MSITLNLPEGIAAEIVRRAERAGQTPDDFVAEAMRRQLAVEQFRDTREALAGQGEQAGFRTDADVFDAIS